MYLYFNSNGVLKEIVDDKSTRKGSSEINKIYIYIEDTTPKSAFITYETSDGVKTNEYLIDEVITKTIPYNRYRDLKYFKDFQNYTFRVATIPNEVLNISGLTKASVRIALQDDTLFTLGMIVFTIEESVVLENSYISESEYQYLLKVIAGFDELNNTGVIGISTAIVDGSVSPYDLDRIVISLYNNNFTIARVIAGGSGNNVYKVVYTQNIMVINPLTSYPYAQGLQINGVNYRLAMKLSDLINDTGFITGANYYTKSEIDEIENTLITDINEVDSKLINNYYDKTTSDTKYVLTSNYTWDKLPNKPTTLSAFTNDEGFITNAVINLVNYYDKTTVDSIINTIKTGAYQVVSELPATGKEGVMYLVGIEPPYEMYVWENNEFIEIGTTEIDLTGYVKGTNLTADTIVMGNGASNIKTSTYTVSQASSVSNNVILTASVINTLLGAKQDLIDVGNGLTKEGNEIASDIYSTDLVIDIGD